DGACSLIAAAAHDRDAGHETGFPGGLFGNDTGDLGPFVRRRHPGFRDVECLKNFRRPVALPDVHEKRARRACLVRLELARQVIAYLAPRPEHLPGPLRTVQLVLFHAETQRCGKAGHGRIPRDLDEPFAPAGVTDDSYLLAGTLVVPEDRW